MSQDVIVRDFYGYNTTGSSGATIITADSGQLLRAWSAFICDIHGPLEDPSSLVLNGIPLCTQCLLAAFGGHDVAELEGESDGRH